MTNQTVNSAMRFFLIALCTVLIAGCNQSNNKPDVSDINADIRLLRFDRDFFSMDTTHLPGSIEQLNRKYPRFLPLYAEFLSPINLMVRAGRSFDESVLVYHRSIKPLYDATQQKFKNLDKVEKDLESGLKFVKYYYPSFRLPAVVASVENFNPGDPQEIYGTTYYHDTLIISLQMFLGKDFEGYNPQEYPDYLRRRFNEQFIVPNCLRAIANSLYLDTSESASLIEQMIERGKQWYLLDHFLPDTPDSLKTGFNQSQSGFVVRNEGNLWSEFLKNTPDPYTLEQERLKNYLGEGPFTQDMPHDLNGNGTPGNIGQWLGWRIVEKFAERNPEMTVQQVLSTPARKIFQESKYKPK